MLTKEDLSQIRGVVADVVEPAIFASEKRVITTIIHAVGEMFDKKIVAKSKKWRKEMKMLNLV